LSLETTDMLGTVAGALTTISFVPQVLKIWKSKSAGDISFGMFLLFSSGIFLWLVYGIMIGAQPIIVANSVTLVLALAIVVMKIRYK
jgi:MtN3 and saliva related transmembrane protein